MATKQSTRIQTSILNAAEKKALVWMAERCPKWITSDMLTFLGFLGAVTIGAGYALCGVNYNFLWLASLGFVINWVGDSMDGTLARVRNQQRPVYGYFLDHNIDCINEAFMFIGLGLSPMLHLSSALLVFAAYLILSVYVYINAHLKGEFKLTFAKFGPTEFRIIAIILNTILLYVKPIREFTTEICIFGSSIELKSLDIAALVIFATLVIMYLTSLLKDAKYYSALEPLKKNEK